MGFRALSVVRGLILPRQTLITPDRAYPTTSRICYARLLQDMVKSGR